MKLYTYKTNEPRREWAPLGCHVSARRQQYGADKVRDDGDGYVTIFETTKEAYTVEAVEAMRGADIAAGFEAGEITSKEIWPNYKTVCASDPYTWRPCNGDGMIYAGTGASEFRSNNVAPAYYTTPEHLEEVRATIKRHLKADAESQAAYYSQPWV